MEAMSIGLGGKLMVIYRRSRAKTLAAGLFSGVAIIGISIITSVILSLEPLHFAVLVLIYLFVAGKILGLFGSRLVSPSPIPPLPAQSDAEIEAIVHKRGLGKKSSKKEREKTH